MKLRNLLPPTRRSRIAVAACGVAVLIAAGWAAKQRSAVAPAGGAQPLDIVHHPQDPKDLFKGHESAVRSSLVEALALAKDVPYPRRTEILRATGGDLDPNEIDLLVAALLATSPTSDAGGLRSTWFSEIANLLHRQPAARERLARALATVALDPSRDATLRDYALQHLRVVWNDSGGDTGLRDSITASLRKLIRADKTVTTAALLSLHLLGDDATAPDNPVTRALPDAEVGSLAAHLLEGPAGSCQPAERMTAARIAGERRITSLIPQLRRIASSPSEHILSRMAAVAALGHMADASNRAFLESLAKDQIDLAPAARHALSMLPE